MARTWSSLRWSDTCTLHPARVCVDRQDLMVSGAADHIPRFAFG